MKIVMAKSAADLLRGAPVGDNPTSVFSSRPAVLAQPDESSLAMAAARKVVQILARRTQATGGLILLDRYGSPGWAFNTPRMSYGYVQSDGTLFTEV